MFDDPVVVTLSCAGLFALAVTVRFLALILLPPDHWLTLWLERDTGDGGGWFGGSSSQDGSDGGCGGDGGGD